MSAATRPSHATPDLFTKFLSELGREEVADAEPERFSAEWEAWLKRHSVREGLRAELHEAAALTTDERDPAPLVSEGLAVFVDWCRRQHRRRS